MGEAAYPTLKLSQRLGQQWSNLEAARELSNQKITELKEKLAGLDSEDISIVILGSLSRKEFTPDSDIDWYLLVDGIADPNHHAVLLDAEKRIRDFAGKDVGREKTFATIVSSHDLIHNVGGEDDTNNNLTRRMLLLLESTPVTGSIAHERVVRNILKRYLMEDRSFWRPGGPHIPHFLLNDFARLWGTMAVDFAYKLRARSGDKWAIRNIKLRLSRKLLYVAGLLACFHSHLLLDEPEERETVYKEESFRPEIVELVHSIFLDSPLDIVSTYSEKLEDDAAVSQVFRAYDEFLGVLLDSGQRKHLEELEEAAADSDPVYQNVRETSHRFRDGLLDLFFGKKLKLLTRQYGVF
jgi:predicted nucleotidyltransferase